MNMFLLSIKNGRQRGRSFPIDKTCVVVGRDGACDIVLGDHHVSRKQFQMVQRGQELRLVDLGGKNTTLHNGAIVEDTVVCPGDEISAGNTVFQVLEQRVESDPNAQTGLLETRSIASHDIFVSGVTVDGGTAAIAGHSVEELVQLFQAGREWSECEDMAGLVASCEGWLVRLFDASALRIILRNEGDDSLRWRRASDLVEPALDRRGQTQLEKALSDQCGSLDGFRNQEGAVATRMIAPLCHGGAIMGGLLIEANAPARIFDESDLRMFLSLARTFAPYFHSVSQIESLQGACRKLRSAEEVRNAIIGESRAIAGVRGLSDSAAAHHLPVIILGETGTGKELVAERIHRHSSRRDEPFVTVNCAAIPRDLFESEFFGHVRGAFTGAVQDRKGRIPEAGNGTLFLDEIGELKEENQAKLLRFLESGEYHKIGDPTRKKSTARVLAASNRDLLDMVSKGEFRSDLYYRLCGQVIHIAPLRQRKEDIESLANHFFNLARTSAKRPVRGISKEAMDYLRQNDWPGNVRELRQTVERAVHIGTHEELELADLALPVIAHGERTAVTTLGTLEDVTRVHIEQVFAQCGGDVDEAARRLGMGRTTLYGKIKQYGLRRAGS